MTTPEAPSSTDSPVAPAPAPPGDFTTASFWESPSSYITLGTLLLPIIAILLPGHDVTKDAQTVATLAPVLAFVALIISRAMHKTTVVKANASLAVARMQQQQQAPAVAAPTRTRRPSTLQA